MSKRKIILKFTENGEFPLNLTIKLTILYEFSAEGAVKNEESPRNSRLLHARSGSKSNDL